MRPVSRIGFLDVGDLLHLAVEHDRQRLADVLGGELVEAVTTVTGEGEDHVGTATLFGSSFGRAQIASTDGRDAADEVVDIAASLPFLLPMLLPLMMTASEGRMPPWAASSFLLTAVGAAVVQALADFQHGGGLHDFLDPGGIVDAGKLDENLVVAEAVFLNHRLGDAELVDTVADGFDGLLDGALLDGFQHGRLEGDVPGVIRAGDQIVFAELVGDRASEDRPRQPMSTPRRVTVLRSRCRDRVLRMSPKVMFFFFSASFSRSIV